MANFIIEFDNSNVRLGEEDGPHKLPIAAGVVNNIGGHSNVLVVVTSHLLDRGSGLAPDAAVTAPGRLTRSLRRSD